MGLTSSHATMQLATCGGAPNLTVHVIDDDPAIRDAISLLLKAEGMEVQAYPSAPDFLGAVQNSCNGCVVVTDVRLPGISGIELVSIIKERGFSIPVIMITGHADVQLAVMAMKLGACDFIEKPFKDDALIEAVRAAIKRSESQSDIAEIAEFTNRFESLTSREKQVLERVISGETNKVIAHKLGISIRTVEVHRSNLIAKTGAKNLAELVRMFFAVQEVRQG
jgi:two-component system, LuxR family, response regulator FixJ